MNKLCLPAIRGEIYKEMKCRFILKRKANLTTISVTFATHDWQSVCRERRIVRLATIENNGYKCSVKRKWLGIKSPFGKWIVTRWTMRVCWYWQYQWNTRNERRTDESVTSKKQTRWSMRRRRRRRKKRIDFVDETMCTLRPCFDT